MEQIQELIKKYDCTIKIYTKDGVDTKINFESIAKVVRDVESIKAKNEKEAIQDLLNMFENLLQQRSGVQQNG